MEKDFIAFVLFIIGTSAFALLMHFKHRKKQPDRVSYVGVIEKLCVYPVKSCSAIEVETAECTPIGLQISDLIKDRHFAVIIQSKIDDDPCNVLTQRQCPRLALLRLTTFSSSDGNNAEIEASSVLRLNAPDMPNLDVQLPFRHQAVSGTSTVLTARLWGVTIYGKDCGPNAAAWLRIFLGRDDVLLMHSETEDHLKALSASSGMPSSVMERLTPTDKTAYADWAPLLLVNTSSIDDVNAHIVADFNENERAAFRAVTYKNFRPNVLLRSEIPFDEDNFDQIFIVPASVFNRSHVSFQLDASKAQQIIASSSVILRNVKPCDRCVLTTVDPTFAEKRADGQPLKTLRTYRLSKDYSSPLFGINCVPDKIGGIRVGDVVLASYVKK